MMRTFIALSLLVLLTGCDHQVDLQRARNEAAELKAQKSAAENELAAAKRELEALKGSRQEGSKDKAPEAAARAFTVLVKNYETNVHVGQCWEVRTPTRNPNLTNVRTECDNNYDTTNAYVTVEIRNDTDAVVKDLTITCDSVAPSGTVLGNSQFVIYEAFKPGEVVRKRLQFPKQDQARTVKCEA